MTDIRKAYDAHPRFTTDVVGEAMTKQSFKDECDINVLMKKFERDGLMSHVSTVEGRYGDFGDGSDFHDAMNIVRRAQEMFETVPANLRAEFGNDPGAFLDFVVNAEDDVLRERGLLPSVSVDPAPAVAVVPEGSAEPAGEDPGPVST